MDKTDAKLSFETALGKLETIVESMESGEVPLAELLAKFEEGTKLLKICENRLKEAELKIEQLKQTKDGGVALSEALLAAAVAASRATFSAASRAFSASNSRCNFPTPSSITARTMS